MPNKPDGGDGLSPRLICNVRLAPEREDHREFLEDCKKKEHEALCLHRKQRRRGTGAAAGKTREDSKKEKRRSTRDPHNDNNCNP
jgi:hypothetical protein